MKKLRKVLIVLAVILGVFLVVALALPAKYTVTKTTVIKTNKETVFLLVGDLQHWNKWTAWGRIDPEAAFTFSTPAYGLKANMAWEGKKIGKGSLKFVQYSEDNSVHYQVDILKPFKMRSVGNITLAEVPEGTQVTWTDNFKASYPIGRYMALIMGASSKVGKQLEEGLAALKTEAEKLPRVELPSIQVELVQHSTQWIASRRIKVASSEVEKKIGETFSEISKYLQERDIVPLDTAPVCFFYRRGVDSSDIKPGLMIEAPLEIKDTKSKILLTALYEGTLAKVDYYGDYRKIGPTYKAFRKWLSENNMQTAADPWEVYITDPYAEPDTAKWHTIICFPVRETGGGN